MERCLRAASVCRSVDPLAPSPPRTCPQADTPPVPFLQREPSTSTFSLSTAHDALSSLSKTNADLTRSLSALKAELEAKAADYEVQAEELLARADELRVELGVSRREEKELRGREAAGLRQIAVVRPPFFLPRLSVPQPLTDCTTAPPLPVWQFEAEIATLHKALDRSKASYQALVKMHHEQMQASEDLRNAVRERDVEAVEARETIDGLRADGEKVRSTLLLLSLALPGPTRAPR